MFTEGHIFTAPTGRRSAAAPPLRHHSLLQHEVVTTARAMLPVIGAQPCLVPALATALQALQRWPSSAQG